MQGDEMVEKARAAIMRNRAQERNPCPHKDDPAFCEHCDFQWIESLPQKVASFARSEVRDAVRELEPYLKHLTACAVFDEAKDLPCDCGLSALRKKFEGGRMTLAMHRSYIYEGKECGHIWNLGPLTIAGHAWNKFTIYIFGKRVFNSR